MKRYFFDLIVDGRVARDEEGLLLAGPAEARRKASVSLAELAREEFRLNSPVSRMAILVRTVEGPTCETAFQWQSKLLQ
jgi:hypothetical protein